MNRTAPLSHDITGSPHTARAVNEADELAALAHLEYTAPFGVSNIPRLWNADPASRMGKTVAFAVTFVALGLLPLYPGSMLSSTSSSSRSIWSAKPPSSGHSNASLFPVPDTHPASVVDDGFYAVLGSSAGISADRWHLLCSWVFGIVLVLATLDKTGLVTQKFWENNEWFFGVYHTGCYDQLFLEPRRKGRMIARLGNSFSNFSFLLAGFVALDSSIGSSSSAIDVNPMWLSDAIFGALLVTLGIFSFFWHAGNSMKMHYPDLWAMDGCIFYLILRFLALAAGKFVVACFMSVGTGANVDDASFRGVALVAHTLCLGAYLLLLVSSAVKGHLPEWWSRPAGEGSMDFTAFWCIRYRYALAVKPSSVINNMTQMTPVTIGWICLYLALPVIYVMLPCMSIIYIGAGGSIFAAQGCIVTLVIGWTYRGLQERWAGDGNVLANCFLPSPQTRFDTTENMSSCSVAALAVVSPTAAMHALTGFTLLFGFLWARSVDQQFFAFAA